LAVTPQLSLGATGKWVYEKIHDFSGHGLGADLGGLYSLPDGRTRIGGMVQNIGTEIQAVGEEKAGFPTVFKLGISHILKGSNILVSAEVNKPVDNDFFYNLGAEIYQIRPLVLRAGWSSLAKDLKTGEGDDNLAGFGFGIGFSWQKYKIDYAYSSFASLGGIHRMTLSGGVN
jgi:hypothetical protein